MCHQASDALLVCYALPVIPGDAYVILWLLFTTSCLLCSGILSLMMNCGRA